MTPAIDEATSPQHNDLPGIDPGGVPVPSDRYPALKIDLHGGSLCLNFTNTAVWRMRPQPDDTLVDYSTLVAWCLRTEALSPAEADTLLHAAAAHPAEAAAALARATNLRESLYRIFVFEIAGHPIPDPDLTRFNHELSHALAHATVSPGDAGLAWHWQPLPSNTPSLTRPLWPILRSAADLLTSPDLPRVKRCPGKDCGWLFLDTSKNASRRWCDMAVCGNRARVRAFAARKRGVRDDSS